MNTSFLCRLLAYIIDIILVGLAVSVTCSVLSKNISLPNVELKTFGNQLVKGE